MGLVYTTCQKYLLEVPSIQILRPVFSLIDRHLFSKTDVAKNVCFFKSPLEKQDNRAPLSIVEDKTDEEESDESEYLLCRKCNEIITRSAERIEVQGMHQHTFANPHGLLFEIGCFKQAIGCGYTGYLTDEFTWFKGFSWKIAICGRCTAHMGWLFVSKGNESFNGLILSQLIQSK